MRNRIEKFGSQIAAVALSLLLASIIVAVPRAWVNPEVQHSS